MPAAVQSARWFFDENSVGVAKSLQYVRGDVTWPGGPDNLIPKGAKDHEWLPVVGKTGLVVLTRDKRIQKNRWNAELYWTTTYGRSSRRLAVN